MNRKLKRIWRSATALCMAFVMMFSTCGTVFAEGSGVGPSELMPEKTINYVSIGDSMTNGLGLGNGYDATGRNGYTEICTIAYPALVANNYEWDLTQLATSAMRAEDLHYILEYGMEGAYQGDEWTRDDLVGHGSRWGKDGVEVVSNTFQSSIKEAGVVSMAVGNANFGVYLMDMITTTIGLAGYGNDYSYCTLDNALKILNVDEGTKSTVKTIYNKLLSYLSDYVPAELADTLANRMAYVVTSYMINYEGALSRIVELNPDVEIIIVGLMNTMSGFELNVTSQDGTTHLDMAAMLDIILNPMNAYLAGLPTVKQGLGEYAEAKLYYAELDRIETHSKTFKEVYQDESNLIRDRFVDTIVGTSENPGMVWGLMEQETFITLKDITDYEAAVLYKTVDGKDEPKSAEEQIEGILSYISRNTYGKSDSEKAAFADKVTAVVTYLTFENAILGALEKDANVDLTKVVLPEGEFNLMAVIAANMGSALEDTSIVKPAMSDKVQQIKRVTNNQIDDNSAMMAATALVQPVAMAETLNNHGLISALLSLYGRMQLANGMAAHPNANDHQAMYEEIVRVYDNNHTVQDETIANIQSALEALCEVLETYGPEVAAQVWAQWEEYGYVEAVNKTIDELTEVLEARYEVYTTETIPAVNASVAALAEQKDALTVQLAGLNEQLAAKKAELEKVLSEQEIGSVTAPDINIDVELGNNEQTEVPEHDCVVSVEGNAIVAELEAAIKDIEHAIATVEALVTDVEADIEDMVALAVQIADAVASLETTIKDIAKAANDLKNAVEAVYEVLTNESAGSIVSTVIGTYETVRAAALEAANLLDIAMGAAEETMADIDNMVGILSEDAEALYNKFMTELPGCIAQIPEEGMMVIGAAVLGLQKAYEEGEKLINEKLTAEIAALEAEYADDIEKAKADLEAGKAEIQAKIQAEIDAKYAEAVAETQLKIDAAKAEAEEKLAALEAELKQYQDELAALGEEAAEEVRQTIQAKIDRVTADINTVNEDLACAVEHLETALQLTYEAIVAEVNALYAEAVAQLEKVYNDIVAELEAAKKALEEAAEKSLEELKEAVDKQIEELNKIGEELSEELNSVLDSIRENIKDIQDAVEGILSGSLESVEELKNALEAMGAEALAELVDIIVEQINAMLLEATTADMVVDDDFKFVAIGDESAKAEGYVEMLAAAINAEAAENGVDEIEVVNNAKTGNTVALERANLSDVTDADLVTIGFSNVTFLSNALDVAMSGKTDFDWAGLLGEEALPYVEDVLADIKAEIAALELKEEYAVMLETIVEAMAYNAVEYAATLPGLISDIKAVNSDALIIIVGMYNPLADTTINLGGAEFDVSEYVDYLVDAVAVHGTAYAIISGDAIYVDARDVDVANPDKELSELDLAMLVYNKCAALYPSTLGDDYIASEIADALNITYVRTAKLLGDVNDDGVVDVRDLVRLEKYFAQVDGAEINALNSDVNEDGLVDTRDMVRLAKYFAQVEGVVLGK